MPFCRTALNYFLMREMKEEWESTRKEGISAAELPGDRSPSVQT